MSLIGILLLATIIYIVYHISLSQEEHFTQFISPPPYKDNHKQQKNELQNVLSVLKRPITKGKGNIENITLPYSGLPIRSTESQAVSIKAPPKAFLRDDLYASFPSGATTDPEMACLPADHPIYEIVKARQPYMFDKPEIIKKDGEMFYHDWRYPQKPINVKFAADPIGYCKKNPGIYPCTVISSRIDIH